MNNFVIDTPDNFWQIRWLDKYMEGHKGFIAGGCFKNILSGERVKDIDIFFESESDFQEAIDSFNDEKHQKEGWKFKYRNEKACAFQKEGEKVWIELSVKAHLCSVFSGFVKIGDWYLKMSEVKEYKPVTAEDMNPYILFKTSKFGNIKVRFLKDEDMDAELLVLDQLFDVE